MAFQAALWTHARTEARAAARDAAVLVARFGAEPADVVTSTTESLDAKSSLIVTSVDIPSLAEIRSAGYVEVRIDAVANGIIIGTSRAITVTEAVPFEEFRP